jgi:hypothetical protein
VGRPSTTGGVSARGINGIQYDFMLEGVRYRPTVKQIPTEANLRRAREHVKAIKERIRLGTFSFVEEFPDFRDLHKLINRSPWRTCNQVFDEYLQQCESRLALQSCLGPEGRSTQAQRLPANRSLPHPRCRGADRRDPSRLG